MFKKLLLASTLLFPFSAQAQNVFPGGSSAWQWPTLAILNGAGVWTINPVTFVAPNSTITASSIYSSIYPGITFSDNIQSVKNIPAGTTSVNNTGIAAYVQNASGTTPTGGNGVGLFAAVQSVANNSTVWGVNTLCMDNATRAVGTLTGNYCIGAEFDFNIMSTGTQVVGVSAGGNSLSQPAASNAFVVNSLGTGIKWGAGFTSLDGAANAGLALGAKSSSGSNIESQDITLNWKDGSGTAQVMLAKMTGGYLYFQNTGSWNGVAISGNFTAQANSAFTGPVTLGVQGTTVGSLSFANATSGTITLKPTTGSLGTAIATLPANTGTVAELNLAQTWSANQSFGATNLLVNGTSTGATTIGTANTSATSYTATLPANTGTLAELNLAQSWTAAQTFSGNVNIVNLAISATAPTVASGGGCGTSPSIVSNGTAAFQLTIGTTPTATTACVVTMPTAATGWACSVTDIGPTAIGTTNFLQRQTASTTTSISIGNMTTAGALGSLIAGDKYAISCHAY